MADTTGLHAERWFYSIRAPYDRFLPWMDATYLFAITNQRSNTMIQTAEYQIPHWGVLLQPVLFRPGPPGSGWVGIPGEQAVENTEPAWPGRSQRCPDWSIEVHDWRPADQDHPAEGLPGDRRRVRGEEQHVCRQHRRDNPAAGNQRRGDGSVGQHKPAVWSKYGKILYVKMSRVYLL